jgi:hypothetical protein
MPYVIGWSLLAAIIVAVAIVLRKAGAPGGEEVRRPAPGSCCSAPPEVPPRPETRVRAAGMR